MSGPDIAPTPGLAGEDACFVGCVLPPSQFKQDNAEARPGPNDFTDDDIRRLDLTGLPVNWNHEDDKTLGVVEQDYTTDSGAKYVVVRMATDNPFGFTAKRQIEEGEMNEMSLTHKFRWGTRGNGELVEHRLPISIGVTKKGNREGCLIHPNSVWTEPPSNRFRETLYSRTFENSKEAADRAIMSEATPDANQTPVATPATPATPVAAAPVAAAPAAAVPAPTAQSVSDQVNVLAELSDEDKVKAFGLKPEEYVKLTSLAAQRGAKLEATLGERDAALAKQQAELLRIKAELEAAQQRDKDTAKLAQEMFETKLKEYQATMQAVGFPMPAGTMDIFNKSRSDNPAELLKANQMAEAIFANGAAMAHHIKELEATVKREQAFAAKQQQAQDSALHGLTERFKAANDALAPASELRADTNQRPLKRARPEDEADSAHGTVDEAAAAAAAQQEQQQMSSQTAGTLDNIPDWLMDQLPAYARPKTA